jgi:hypothetical protein
LGTGINTQNNCHELRPSGRYAETP